MHRQNLVVEAAATILGTVCVLLLLTAQGQASDNGRYTEEFHQTYPLAAGGRVELHNINGAVHITARDQNQVKVDAVKYAGTKERLGALSDFLEISLFTGAQVSAIARPGLCGLLSL